MKSRTLATRLGAMVLATGLAFPAIAGNSEINWSPAAKEQQAEVPFVGFGGIRNWQAYDNRTLYVEGSGRQWYRADLMGPCIGLNYAEAIGLDTHPMNTLDKFSTIVVDGQRCHVKSVVKVDGRPSRESARREINQ